VCTLHVLFSDMIMCVNLYSNDQVFHKKTGGAPPVARLHGYDIWHQQLVALIMQ